LQKKLQVWKHENKITDLKINDKECCYEFQAAPSTLLENDCEFEGEEA
jgi:hypothetical protein